MDEVEQQKILQKYRSWLRTTARNIYKTQPGRVEDLAQEGWIAMWRVLKKEGDVPEHFLKNAAICRMRNIIRDDHRDCRDIRRSRADGLPAQSIDNHGAEAETPSVWVKLQTDLGAIELAYHHGEIADALNALTPTQREYVVLKFWYGLSHAELVSHFGYKPAHLWHRSKATLEKELAHLGAN
jgi:RNA polymerase sigma factor (sigma-70 family)